MRWFEASPRRAAPKGPVLHLPRSTASRSSAYIKLLSAFVTHVLVDHSAEDSAASNRGVAGDRGGRVVGWRVLIQALVRAVVIEVAHVPVKNSSGVSFVVDQQSVGAFGAGRCR